MHSLEFYQDWLDHNGKTVFLHGVKHRLEVKTLRAIYPYPRMTITVSAVPVNKRSGYYREIRARLGDDWSVDVLASFEVENEILNQLKG